MDHDEVNAHGSPGPGAPRRIVAGALAGGGVIVAIMLMIAIVAVARGMIARDEGGRLDLTPWLLLEVVGGGIACIMGGVVCRRIAGRFQGPVVLATGAVTIAFLEAAEILHHAASGRVVAPRGLVLLAPLVTGVGVLLGGWIPSRGLRRSMPAHRSRRLNEALRYGLPLAVLAVAVAVASLALPRLAMGSESAVVASALTLDFTVVVPGLVYMMLVRARRVPWIIIVPTTVAGYAVARAVIPGHQQALLDLMRWLVIPLELGIVSYLVVLTRRTVRNAAAAQGDFATRLRFAARNVLASRVPADVLTTEVSLIYYALGPRRRRLPAAGEYTVHRGVGYASVVVGLMILLVVETLPLHMLVSQWSPVLAWVLAGLNVYGGIWLLGDYRSMNARPMRITATHLLLRVGLRWEADVPLAQIAHADPFRKRSEAPGSHTLVAALLGQPNLRLRLNAPVDVVGMYGMRKTAQEIWLTVDRPDELCDRLGKRAV